MKQIIQIFRTIFCYKTAINYDSNRVNYKSDQCINRQSIAVTSNMGQEGEGISSN